MAVGGRKVLVLDTRASDGQNVVVTTLSEVTKIICVREDGQLMTGARQDMRLLTSVTVVVVVTRAAGQLVTAGGSDDEDEDGGGSSRRVGASVPMQVVKPAEAKTVLTAGAASKRGSSSMASTPKEALA